MHSLWFNVFQEGRGWQSATGHHPPRHLGLRGEDDRHSHGELRREMVTCSLFALKFESFNLQKKLYWIKIGHCLRSVPSPFSIPIAERFSTGSSFSVRVKCRRWSSWHQYIAVKMVSLRVYPVLPTGLYGSLPARWCWCPSTRPVRITPRGYVFRLHALTTFKCNHMFADTDYYNKNIFAHFFRCASSLRKLVSWQTLTLTPAVFSTRKSVTLSWPNITSFLVRIFAGRGTSGSTGRTLIQEHFSIIICSYLETPPCRERKHTWWAVNFKSSTMYQRSREVKRLHWKCECRKSIIHRCVNMFEEATKWWTLKADLIKLVILKLFSADF